MTDLLDRFFEQYYRLRPVNATFTGIHAYDRLLPDWSAAGVEAMNREMRELAADLAARYPEVDDHGHTPLDGESIDARLAADFLAIQLAENDSTHGIARNPSLWTGEAIMGVASIMLRDFAPLRDRFASATARLAAIPDFLLDARAALAGDSIPGAWSAKALTDCVGGAILFSSGIDRWIESARGAVDAKSLREAAGPARDALLAFAEWLRAREAAADDAIACGPALYDILLARGHHCPRAAGELLRDARATFEEERGFLQEMVASAGGSLEAALERIATDHPAPDDYLSAFERVWSASHDVGVDAVTWHDWPIRYVPYPAWIEESAPYLYYLHYRSPAPFDPYNVHDYLVSPLPEGEEERHLRSWNNSAIKLNHVVHHGGIGHHVQNWHAVHQARSRIGQVAAVDCANRIGMFSGGTMAEGWACYVTRLMDEMGFLTPLERIAEQHTRVRFVARTIVDIEMHHGTMSLEDGIRFYMDRVGMSAPAARGEAVRNSMYPCAATMYWLGTQGILDLRAAMQKQRGAEWSLKAFHDELLEHGSIPIPLVARLMSETTAPSVTPR